MSDKEFVVWVCGICVLVIVLFGTPAVVTIVRNKAEKHNTCYYHAIFGGPCK